MSKRPEITLVVDDDPANRTGLTRLLQYAGRLVDCAASVAEAIEKLKQRPAIVLLDLNLPDGTGAQILQHIRDQKLSAKVCVITGSATVETLAAIKELRPDEIILKPFHPERVLQWVNQAYGDETVPQNRSSFTSNRSHRVSD